MKRAFLAIVWGIATTEITGPYDTAEGARTHAEDEVREGDQLQGAVLGPFPISYLNEEVETPSALQTSSPDQLAEVIDQAVTFAVNAGGVGVAEAIGALDHAAMGWAENLEDGGVRPLNSAFGRTLAANFRPSELLALYNECEKEAADDVDRGKMVYIREAYTQLTGDEL